MEDQFNIENFKKLEQSNLRLSTILSIHKLKMDSVARLTESVNKNHSTASIIQLLEDDLRNLMKVENFALFVNTSKWELLLNEGFKKDIDDIDFDTDFQDITDITNVSNSNDPNFRNFDYIIPVFHKEQALAYLFIKNIEIGDIDCSEEEKIKYLETLLNLTIISLENKKMFRELKSSSKYQEEIELAANVQKELIPSEFPLSEMYEFQGKYIPFQTVGGDYYDLIEINKETIAFCICDVSGKGISAGMLMSNFQAALRTLLSRKLSLVELVKQLNSKFLSITKQGRYISMFIAKYDLKTRKLEYINAGHNPPVLKSNDKLSLLEKGCTILGILEEIPFIESDTIYIESDTILAMYTDGFSEIENDFGIEFGVENIGKHLVENEEMSLKDLTDGFMKKLHDYKGSNKIFDDISLLCAKFPMGEL